jgi:hypothetical protein
MERLQAYKFELKPNGEQQRNMRRFAGSCRFVFNKALALQKERFDAGEKKLGYAGLCKLLTEWRNSSDTAWLADAPVHPLQQTLKDLELTKPNRLVYCSSTRANHTTILKRLKALYAPVHTGLPSWRWQVRSCWDLKPRRRSANSSWLWEGQIFIKA